MKICVLGTGYVGLVAGTCLSDSGNHVTCLDVDKEKVKALKQGVIPIFEPGLDEIVARNAKAKRLAFSTDPAESLAACSAVFLAVGTPQGDDGSSNLTYFFSAVETVKKHLKHESVVVIKSTVPVGTADKVKEILKGHPFVIDVVSNPEFLKEGTAVNDFLRPERVIIGASTEAARQVMRDLYAPYVRSGNPILFMSNRSAELAKYAANAFLAMKISFINDMALMAERLGADIYDVRSAIVTDSRIGNKFLYPGCGYGGSCFPKDVLALIHTGKEHGLTLDLFAAVHATNERQKRLLFQKMSRHFGSELRGKTVAVWGLAFKPGTDDMREAPSVALIQQLLDAGCRVRAYDPVANHEAKRLFEGRIELFDNAYEVVRGSDALAIMTEWNEFRSPDFELLKSELRGGVVFDGRNLFERESLARYGLKYYCIGKPDPT